MYLTLKYGNIKINLYLEGRSSSKVVAWWRCTCCYRKTLKDLGEILHHFVPLHARACSSNRLIEYYAPSFFFSFAMEGLLGIWERLSSRETSSIPNLLYLDLVGDMHWKKKLIKNSLLWYHWSGLFSARNERRDITQKYSEILQERQQYNRDIA